MIYAFNFKNLSNAFSVLYKVISEEGEVNEDTKRLTGVLMEITNPFDWTGMPAWRGWKRSYVDLEWQWYMSENRSPAMVEKVAPIWKRMKDENGLVHSNYGYQVARNNQWKSAAAGIADAFVTGRGTRKHVVSIFDGKESPDYKFDTPCTISFTFILRRTMLDWYLDMHSHMRSNDLWFGFCNDIPAFAMFLDKMSKDVNVALNELNEWKTCKPGRIKHFVDDLHIYNEHLGIAT